MILHFDEKTFDEAVNGVYASESSSLLVTWVRGAISSLPFHS